jgi:phage-related protein
VIVTSAGWTFTSRCSQSTRRISGEPYTRHLSGKVRELRFHLLAQQTRVTYWLAPGRRVILLTVFRKTRNAETAEVARAVQAQKVCQAEHGPAYETYDREVP